MSFDASSYSSLGRRRTPSYSLSSGSNRSSFSSDYGSSSSYGFSPGLSSLGSRNSSFSTSGLSGSMYSSRPPSASSFSSRSSREGSFLSSSMMKRDSIINSLVRSSHDLNRHDFLPADATSLRPGSSSHISHRSFKSVDRSRSQTTDLSLSSFAARPGSDLGCFSSFTTTSGYGTTYRSTYRPILIQRPTFDNYTPRPREERQKIAHFKSIRRDRPLVKFREKEEDVDPEKVKQLLDSWSPETIEERDEDDYETRKRDSVRSNDSGIGSFRSSFGNRSRKKSGEFLSYDLSPTIDEKDSGTEDNVDISSDRRCGRHRRVDHVSSVDEGVHMDADYESRSPRDIVSPLGYHDSMSINSRPFSRNCVQNVPESPEITHSITLDESPSKSTETSRTFTTQSNKKYPSNTETSSPIVQSLPKHSETLGVTVVQNEEKHLSNPEIKSTVVQSPSKNLETLRIATVKNKEICPSSKEVKSPVVQSLSKNFGILRTTVPNKEQQPSSPELKSPAVQIPSKISETLKIPVIQNKEQDPSSPEVKSPAVQEHSRNNNRVRRRSDLDIYKEPANTRGDTGKIINTETEINRKKNFRSRLDSTVVKNDSSSEMDKVRGNQTAQDLIHKNVRAHKIPEVPSGLSHVNRMNIDKCAVPAAEMDIKNETTRKKIEKCAAPVAKAQVQNETAQSLSSTEHVCKATGDSTSQSHVADIVSIADDRTRSSKSENNDQIPTPKDTAEKIKKKKKVKKLGGEVEKTKGLKSSPDVLSKTNLPETDPNENYSLNKSPNETVIPDLSSENSKSELPTSVKQTSSKQTDKGGVHDATDNAKLTDECLKNDHSPLENNHDPKSIGTSNRRQNNGALTKVKGEKYIKTDISSVEKKKRDAIDPEKILSISKDVRQVKSLETSISQTQKVNELKVGDSLPFKVNEVPLLKGKEIIQRNVTSKSDIKSECAVFQDKVKTEEALLQKRDTNQDVSTEKVSTKCLDTQKDHSKTTDLKMPSYSQNIDKGITSSFDAKPPLKSSKEKSDTLSPDEKPKFGFSLLKPKAATERRVPYSQQKLLKTEANKELRSVSEIKLPSISKDTASLVKDGLKHKIGKEANKYLKTSPETKDVKTVEGSEKQSAAFVKSSVSTADTEVRSKCTVPLETTKTIPQEYCPSVSESRSNGSFTDEKKRSEMENNVVSETGLKETLKDTKFSDIDSREKKSSSAEENFKQPESGTHVSLDTKQNVQSDITVPKTDSSISQSELPASGHQVSEAHFTETASKEMTNQQDESAIIDSDISVTVALSEVTTKTGESKKSPFRITKSSSEDFKHDKIKSSEQTTAGNFQLQKSSSADTKVLKRSKPPLPFKTVIPPPGLPISRKEKNNTFHQLQKSSTAGKMDFKTETSETQKLYDLKKSYTTECNRLVKKPLTKDTKLLGKYSCLNLEKIQTSGGGTSDQNSLGPNKLTHQSSPDKTGPAAMPDVLESKDIQSSKVNIPKESPENFAISAQSSAEDDKYTCGEKLKSTGTSQENEINTEVVKPSKSEINANLTWNIQQTWNDQSEIMASAKSLNGATVSEKLNKNENFLEMSAEAVGDTAEVSQQGDTPKASSKTSDASIPISRVSRPYIPKNRLVLSKSDSNVPVRQLMTSSSAPNIAIEKVRAKLAKKSELSEHLGQTASEFVIRIPVQKFKEKDQLKMVMNVNDFSKTNQSASDTLLILQGFDAQTENNSMLPTASGDISSVISELNRNTDELDLKDKQEILSESTIASQHDSKSEQSFQRDEMPCNLKTFQIENSSGAKVDVEKEIVPTKADNQLNCNTTSLDILEHSDLNYVKDKTFSVNEVHSSGVQIQSKTSNTESVEVSKISTCEIDSVQSVVLEQAHFEQYVITKTDEAKCICPEQSSVDENISETTKAPDIPPSKERIDGIKISDTLSDTLPAKQDVAGTVALDAKGAEEQVKPKIKKVKKPKAEGDEKVAKKKKKKKDKLDLTDGQCAVKENAESDKSSEHNLIPLPCDKQGLPKECETTLELNLRSSSDTNHNIFQECGSEDLKGAAASEGIHSEQCTECKTNCHKKCEKSVPHLCGVNEKLLSEVLATVKKAGLASPYQGVTSEASATTDTSAFNICSPTTPQSPAISDTEDVCDHLWSENKRSESTESIRQSRNSSSVSTGPIRFKKYSAEDFHFLKVLGRGSYGKVMLAELKGSNQYFAVKCLKKDVVLEDNDVECTMIEKKVLAMGSSHPYLCTLFSTFQSQSHLFFVMEYLSGGDLMFHIQQSGRFDQERARFYSAEIVCALKYLHKRGIVYRDAKLDNICLDADGHIRLVDFGFCKLRIYRKECLPRNLCGTPDYMAPEIIKGLHYNQSVDWWSFGVLLYEMLIGQSPFNGTDEEELFWSVCNEEAYYPRFISKEAKQLLVLLLEKNPEKRLGMPGCVAGDVCHQPFFRLTNWEKVEKKEVEPPFKPKLKSETDVSNFDSDFTMEKAMLTPIDKQILDSMDQNQFEGFSYTNPRITD